MQNPIFKLLQFNNESLIENYKLECKQAKSEKNYLLIEAKTPIKQQAKLASNGKAYTVTDYHFSVYEDLRLENRGLQSHYHLTVNLVNEQQQTLSGRIYYHGFYKIVHATFKDAADQAVLDIDQASVSQFAKCYTGNFADLLASIYQKLDSDNNKQYELLVNQLNEQSKIVYATSTIEQTALQVYQAQLDQIIAHLERWWPYQLNPTQPLQLFRNLKQQLQEKFLLLNAEAHTQLVSVEPSTDEEAEPIILVKQTKPKPNPLLKLDQEITKLKNDPTLNPCVKIWQEYEWQTKKFELCTDDKQALNCIIRCRELETSALRMLNEYLIFPTRYQDIAEADFERLIAMIPQLNPDCLYRAVNKNMPDILNYLLTYHSKINIDAPFTPAKVYLLDLAYEKKYDGVLRVLLQRGAYADRQDAAGLTLLIKSCYAKQRHTAMRYLLDAGASTLIFDNYGYSAFGYLTMQSEKTGNKFFNILPNYAAVKLFLDHAQGFIIDSMQGPPYRRMTPLLFACQNNWPKLVTLYLSHEKYKADPNVVREPDFNDALALAAIKNYPELCRVVLTHSAYSLEHSCSRALPIAKELGHTEIIDMLEEYIEQHQLQLDTETEERVLAQNFTADLNFQIQALRLGLSLKPSDKLGYLFAQMQQKKISQCEMRSQREDETTSLEPNNPGP